MFYLSNSELSDKQKITFCNILDSIIGEVTNDATPHIINRNLDLNKQRNSEKDRQEMCWFDEKLKLQS